MDLAITDAARTGVLEVGHGGVLSYSPTKRSTGPTATVLSRETERGAKVIGEDLARTSSAASTATPPPRRVELGAREAAALLGTANQVASFFLETGNHEERATRGITGSAGEPLETAWRVASLKPGVMRRRGAGWEAG
jgi:hypothetical protein